MGLQCDVDATLAAQRRILEAGAAARRQLARDLHDGAQQRLVSLLIHLQMAREAAPSDGPIAALLLDAVAEAKAVIDELRGLAAGIHPSTLTNFGLVPAVKSLAARSAIPTALRTRMDRRAPAETETSAYYLIAEALTNVAKHARATHAGIQLDIDGDRLVVTVSDNGIGGAAAGAGSGLIGMHDRVTALRGTLMVDSRRGRGTVITAHLPMAQGR